MNRISLISITIGYIMMSAAPIDNGTKIEVCNMKESMEKSMQEPMQESIIEMVRKNNIEAVKSALKGGTDVNTMDSKKQSLLLIATRAANFDMAELLVTNGANVNMQDDLQDSPFLYAGASGQTKLLSLFLKNGADFTVFNRYNGTALIPACERGHVETVRLLANTKRYPVDHVNRLGWTALMEAVVLGDGGPKYQQIISILKSAGADLNIPDKEGVTALEHAQKKGFAKIVQLLASK